jgi:hypothetical protein
MSLNALQTTISPFSVFEYPLTKPSKVVETVASIKGPLDVYCWYEGAEGVPRSCAKFMSEKILQPLFEQKKEVKVFLYSLKAWSFNKSVSQMSEKSPLEDVINRIDQKRLEWIDSKDFFKYSATPLEKSALHEFLDQELLKKKELIAVSGSFRKSGRNIQEFFDNKFSLFTCLDKWDVVQAYSLMQYVEGYYLVRSSVEKGLKEGKKEISVAFVLPNDESKYYVDFQKDLTEMLQLDFGSSIEKTKIVVHFHYFEYGESLKERPYIDRKEKNPLKADEIGSYFTFLKG